MSLMGIDAGTTGVKAVVFDETGRQLAAAYEEYDFRRPHPGWAELDVGDVWRKTQRVIQRVVPATTTDPISAISASSMGEAMTPVTRNRQILGPSINPNFDLRGEVYLPELAGRIDHAHLYDINGNALGHNYSVVTLKWLKQNQPHLYEKADLFLLWSGLILFMLGAEPRVDYSLANRTLLFDLAQEDWSNELLAWAGLERDKFPETTPSGVVVGQLSGNMAAELGLPVGIPLVAGAHDQCANAVGCGVIVPGLAVLGMGTFFTITPVFAQRRPTELMLARGLNTEHHAVPGLFVSFLYNLGGALVKWYRDTFAAAEHQQARASGHDIYADLFAEMPPGPSSVLVLPHFGPTGPPDFISDSSGVLVGVKLDTPRAAILKGIVEGIGFYLKEVIDDLPATGIRIDELRATGGGAKSDAWLQVVADLMAIPVQRPTVTESSALGAALIAGVGAGRFASFQEGAEAMVHLDRTFHPDLEQHARYQRRFAQYKSLWPLLQDFLRGLE